MLIVYVHDVVDDDASKYNIVLIHKYSKYSATSEVSIENNNVTPGWGMQFFHY